MLYNYVISRKAVGTAKIDYMYNICAVMSNNFDNVTYRSVTEMQLKQILKTQPFLNIAYNVNEDKLEKKSGSLSRFDKSDAVVISVLVDADNTDKIIGYRIMNSKGKNVRLRLDAIVAYCKECVSRDRIPFQNAIFVDASTENETPFVKSYPDCPFPQELMHKVVNKYAITQTNLPAPKVLSDIEVQEIINDSKLLYTPEQIKQLKLGIKAGVNVALYANPQISAEKMELLRLLLENNYDIRSLVVEKYIVPVSMDALGYVASNIMTNIDIYNLLNPDYTPQQLAELHIGLIEYLDINKYADPKLPVDSMRKIRKQLEAGVWGAVTYEEDEV